MRRGSTRRILCEGLVLGGGGWGLADYWVCRGWGRREGEGEGERVLVLVVMVRWCGGAGGTRR